MSKTTTGLTVDEIESVATGGGRLQVSRRYDGLPSGGPAASVLKIHVVTDLAAFRDHADAREMTLHLRTPGMDGTRWIATLGSRLSPLFGRRSDAEAWVEAQGVKLA